MVVPNPRAKNDWVSRLPISDESVPEPYVREWNRGVVAIILTIISLAMWAGGYFFITWLASYMVEAFAHFYP